MSDLDMTAAEMDGLRTDLAGAAETLATTASRRVVPDDDALEVDAGVAPDVEMLRTQQQYALQELIAGKTYADAARTAGVDRKTLFRWVHHDPAFGAALKAWRRQALCAAQDRLTQAAEAAAMTLGAAATTDFRAAAILLKSRGLLNPLSLETSQPNGSPLLESISPERWGEFELRLRELILSFRGRE
ncbi:MAG TPA: hypothetical protein VFE47_07675 [Tepidisphaeraceae bacterium]|nr:hypothetical protein [Tepidisphaeraceae bacterium]